MTRVLLTGFLVVLAPFGCRPLYAQNGPDATATQFAWTFLLGQGAEFRSDTTWHPDGRTSRSIFQETARTPKDVQQAKIWQEMSFPKVDVSTMRSTIFGQIPAQRPKAGDTFFQATGIFSSPDKLPDHVALKSLSGLPASKLIRETTRTDLVFVTEYSWRETLTKMARPGKQHEDLAGIVVDILVQAIGDTVGKDYDPSELVRWLRKEAQPEIVLVLADLDKIPVCKVSETAAPLFEARLKRWGIHSSQDLEAKIVPFIAQRVRDRSGKPAPAELVRGWLDAGYKNAGAGVPHEYGAKFVFTATLPGVVLETNGAAPSPENGGRGGMCCPPPIASRDRKETISTTGQSILQWSFGRHDAQFKDYTMHVRTLSGDQALQKKLLKKTPLDAKESALAYRSLVIGSESLLKVLRECRNSESTSPLRDYRDRLGATQGAEKKRVNQVMELLGLQ